MAFDMNGSGSSQSLLDPMQKKSSSLESQLAGFSRQIQQLQDDVSQPSVSVCLPNPCVFVCSLSSWALTLTV
jgi:hypothetical protein